MGGFSTASRDTVNVDTEHAFDDGYQRDMTGDDTAVHAADLAERILDEVSRAEQNWPAIEHLANALAELAARAAQRANAPRPPRHAP